MVITGIRSGMMGIVIIAGVITCIITGIPAGGTDMTGATTAGIGGVIGMTALITIGTGDRS